MEFWKPASRKYCVVSVGSDAEMVAGFGGIEHANVDGQEPGAGEEGEQPTVAVQFDVRPILPARLAMEGLYATCGCSETPFDHGCYPEEGSSSRT